ncbi:hypothetical protein GCM10023080_077260 [Streptomyces pseudoechinosporeus]
MLNGQPWKGRGELRDKPQRTRTRTQEVTSNPLGVGPYRSLGVAIAYDQRLGRQTESGGPERASGGRQGDGWEAGPAVGPAARFDRAALTARVLPRAVRP